MTQSRIRWHGLVGVGVATALLSAGCASRAASPTSSPVNSTSAPSALTGSGTPIGPAGASPGAPPATLISGGDPSAAGQREADRILTTFVPPPGSARADLRPDLVPSGLNGPPQTMAGPDLVTSTTWYTTTTAPADVLAWLDGHPPTGSGGRGGGSGSSGPSFATFTYQQPAVSPSLLRDRMLIVTPALGADGRTVIRLDAQVVWVPGRGAGEQVPADAKVVTVVATGTMNHPILPKPVTVSDPAVVKQLAELVDALPPRGDQRAKCPADTDARVTLTFRATVDGPDLAVAVADPNGCQPVTLKVGGTTFPPLSGVGAAAANSSFVARAYALLGVTWSPGPG